jgi:hypothetical protein
MLALKQNYSTAYTPASPGNKTYTTLYEIIEAVANVTDPGEERLISTVVKQLLGDYRAKLACDHRNDPAQTKNNNRHLYLYRRADA